MRSYAVEGYTWGVSGPTFLTYFLLLALAVLLYALVRRSQLLRGTAATGSITPIEAGYLADGDTGAVLSAVGSLRAEGTLLADSGVLATRGPTGTTNPLARVVFAAADGARLSTLADQVGVRTELARLRDSLTRLGLLVSDETRHQVRRYGWLMLGVAALGVARVFAGLSTGHPVGFMVLATLATGVAGLLLFAVPRRTREGTRLLADLRARNRHLHPRQSPAWNTYGPQAAALGIGLFGGAALWAADPAFAVGAELPRNGGLTNNSSSSGDSGSGGGGGDGGGGCGGGCGGCGG